MSQISLYGGFMSELIDRTKLLEGVSEMMDKQHNKIESFGICPSSVRDKADGFLEALYHFEKLVLNCETETYGNI